MESGGSHPPETYGLRVGEGSSQKKIRVCYQKTEFIDEQGKQVSMVAYNERAGDIWVTKHSRGILGAKHSQMVQGTGRSWQRVNTTLRKPCSVGSESGAGGAGPQELHPSLHPGTEVTGEVAHSILWLMCFCILGWNEGASGE